MVGGLQQHAQAAAQRIAAQHAQEADIAEQQLQSLEQDWQEALPFSVGLAQPVTESELQWYVGVQENDPVFALVSCETRSFAKTGSGRTKTRPKERPFSYNTRRGTRDDMPLDCWLAVCSVMEPADLVVCMRLSRSWYKVARHDIVWRSKCDALWSDKVYVPQLFRDMIAASSDDSSSGGRTSGRSGGISGRSGAFEAYRLSVLDSQRAWLTQEELCRFVWWSRMKDSAGAVEPSVLRHFALQIEKIYQDRLVTNIGKQAACFLGNKSRFLQARIGSSETPGGVGRRPDDRGTIVMGGQNGSKKMTTTTLPRCRRRRRMMMMGGKVWPRHQPRPRISRIMMGAVVATIERVMRSTALEQQQRQWQQRWRRRLQQRPR